MSEEQQPAEPEEQPAEPEAAGAPVAPVQPMHFEAMPSIGPDEEREREAGLRVSI